ncbi:lysoplasmalogenase [Terrimonas pollutisoli]|uniref:lysoplasmalogenase n=1 Tax=Terrimonas pollutisoli TaxID=3034147 RepID=UPI0023ED7B7C|nr:lysoplasmalogenase [Terrimonas sp. H1YJ31]
MKKKYRIIVFAFILLGDLIAVQLNYKIAEWVFKPLIVIWLLAYFILQTRHVKSDLKKWVIIALLFSWLGDVLLMLTGDNSIFFLLGLSAFLLAHIFYILFFHFVRIRENVKSRWYLLLMVVIYYTFLVSILSPWLGTMKLPVRIYGIVISFMFMLAMHMLFIKNKRAGLRMMIGALLFVISDSVLAINKFYQSVPEAAIIIMLTYGMAQFFIIEGANRYIRQDE